MAGLPAPAVSEAGAVADANHNQNGQPPDDQYEDDEIVTVEATGETVEEAIQKALAELGLEEDEVDVEVLSEGKKGVLGVGSEEARVRVTSLPYEDEEYDEYEEGGQAEEYDEEGLEIAPPGNRRFEPDTAVVGRRLTPAYEEPPRVRRFDPEAEPFAELARQTLSDLLESMQIPAEITLDAAEIDEDAFAELKADSEPVTSSSSEPGLSSLKAQALPTIELSISGEYMGILIGRHGDTLAALQFLLGLLVSRKAQRRVRVIVDVEGYRERRARMLRDMAMRAADRAQRYRQPIFLDPMIPSERRIVHLALQNHPYVATQSIGEGDSRRVVVSPKHR
jgi:spoIIIJ-associated protein